jgi:hypothetical protein
MRRKRARINELSVLEKEAVKEKEREYQRLYRSQ